MPCKPDVAAEGWDRHKADYCTEQRRDAWAGLLVLFSFPASDRWERRFDVFYMSKRHPCGPQAVNDDETSNGRRDGAVTNSHTALRGGRKAAIATAAISDETFWLQSRARQKRREHEHEARNRTITHG